MARYERVRLADEALWPWEKNRVKGYQNAIWKKGPEGTAVERVRMTLWNHVLLPRRNGTLAILDYSQNAGLDSFSFRAVTCHRS